MSNNELGLYADLLDCKNCRFSNRLGKVCGIVLGRTNVQDISRKDGVDPSLVSAEESVLLEDACSDRQLKARAAVNNMLHGPGTSW